MIEPELQHSHWQSQCCVPAFLWRALQAFSDREGLAQEAWHRKAAECLGVNVGPNDPNPWSLPVTTNPERWGVTPKLASERFEPLQALAECTIKLRLDIVKANEVPFGQFEDAVHELHNRGGIVAIGYDLADLERWAGHPLPPKRAHHLVRLTPLAAERELEPNVLSAEFAFDYPGAIRLFDDSGELTPAELCVPWPTLIHAFRAINGAFWAVCPASVTS
jgi:hypothetical protein